MDSSDLARSLFSLVKFNDGLWKSAKQRNFLLDAMRKSEAVFNVEEGLYTFDIKLEEGQTAWIYTSTLRFAEYGYKSVRFVSTMFVFDQHGVKKTIRMKRRYSEDGKSSWIERGDASVHKVLWERSANVEIVELEEPIVPEVKVSEFVGTVGDKISIDATVSMARYLGFGRFGNRYMTIFKDDQGNELVYWGLPAGITVDQKGTRVKLKASVKGFNEYNNKKQTIIQRPKVSIVE